jgi:hypothetical protein
MGFVVMGADCTNAYSNSPSPTQAIYVRIDDAYADWYRSRHEKEVDRSLVLPVLKALQGHPEAGARAKYLPSEIDGTVVLLCRKVDDLAATCSHPSVAQDSIDSIGKNVDIKSQGILNSFNDIDINQRREQVKVSCQSYLPRMLKAPGRDKPSPAAGCVYRRKALYYFSRNSRRQY